MVSDLDDWLDEYWIGDANPVSLGNEELEDILVRFRTGDSGGHGTRARLSRPIRGVRHLPFPEREGIQEPRLVFSGDGRSTYARELPGVRWSDLVGSHPVRDFSRRHGQTNKPIAVYTRTTQDLVNCESRLERSFVLAADFNPEIVHIAAQPFAIDFPPGDKLQRHTVDFVVIGHGRIPVAVDVKPDETARDPEWMARHARVRTILSRAGIGHVVWTGLHSIVVENIAFFAASRVPAVLAEQVRPTAIDASRTGITVEQLAATIAPAIDELGTMTAPGIGAYTAGLVVIRGLLWERTLQTDLSTQFTRHSTVVAR